MRLQLLDSLFELSNEYLQAACWLNPAATNPHYTLIEFVETSPFRDRAALKNEQDTGVINQAEYVVLARLAESLATYRPPNDDWYNHEAVLHDTNWLAVTQTAAEVLEDLLSLSFNSRQWLDK
jgi:hypothetical protein